MWEFKRAVFKTSTIEGYPFNFCYDETCAYSACTGCDAGCDSGMDVAFVLDYTGSMGGVIETAKSGIRSIINTIKAESEGNFYRLSLVLADEYTSPTSSQYNSLSAYTSLPSSQRYINTGLNSRWQWITAMEMFSLNNETSFITQLNKINTPTMPLGNGIGIPEPTDMALDLVINSGFTNTFRENVAKYVIVITDATPGGNDDFYNNIDDVKVAQLRQNCVDKGIKVLVLGTGASLPVWQNLATVTGGGFNTSFNATILSNIIINNCNE